MPIPVLFVLALDSAAPVDRDIAGVNPGMSLEATESALERSGFTKNSVSRTLSYSQLVAKAVARNRGQSWNDQAQPQSVIDEEYRKGDERVIVYFQQTRSGPVAVKIQYELSGEALDFPSLTSKAMAKYGAPTVANDRAMAWCRLASDGKCDTEKEQYLVLTRDRADEFDLNLTDSEAEVRKHMVELTEDIRHGSGDATSF